MGEARSAYGRGGTGFLRGNARKRYHLEVPGTDGKMDIKMALQGVGLGGGGLD